MKEKWANLCCIGAIKTEFEKKGNKTEEWHYYISSRKLTASDLLHHARMEWAVETMYWLLDVHYAEDYSRIENGTIQQNLNMLRKFSLSLIKQFKAKSKSKRAISQIMFSCLLDSLTICSILENWFPCHSDFECKITLVYTKYKRTAQGSLFSLGRFSH